jgi:glycosyltransferase involved in cell wall biosynthesis
MRVAVVNWSSRRVGGVEEYVSVLLPALKKAGVDVAFWYERDEPLDRIAIQVPPGIAQFCAAELGVEPALQALRDWKPDVLYVQATHDVGLERRLLDIAPAIYFLHAYVGTCISGSKTFTRPTVMPCARAFGPPCLAHYFPHGCGGNNPLTMLRLYQSQSERLELLGRYRAILTHTEHMHQEMARHHLNARVVPYPVAAQPAARTRAADGTSQLLFAGRMESIKGGLVLIEAIPLLVESLRRSVRVIMAGDGRDRPRWEARARAIESTNAQVRFEFTGWLREEAVDRQMQNADLLVVPSLWPEPFGSVGPAAGWHGLPAAAFSVGGIPQWLREGVTGHLAPADPPTPQGLARAMLQCLQDPRHHAALSDGARQMARTFSLERHLPELMKVLAG